MQSEARKPAGKARHMTGEVPRPLAERIFHEFVSREIDGPEVEHNIGVRRSLFEAALRQEILRRVGKPGPVLVRRMAA